MEEGDPPSIVQSLAPSIGCLALGPCAMGFFALLGALRDTDLEPITEISGASAGAILGLLLCLGKSVTEIFELTIDKKFDSLVKPNLVSLVTRYGLVPMDPIKTALIELCDGQSPTFRDLKKKLYVSAFCVDTGITEYFSRDTVPDAHVIDFICMSIAVPFLFESVTYRGRLYVDGGLVESVPMGPFLGRRALALRLVPEMERGPVSSLKSFVTRLIRSTLRSIEYEGVTSVYTDVDVFNFSMSLENRLRMFLGGTATF